MSLKAVNLSSGKARSWTVPRQDPHGSPPAPANLAPELQQDFAAFYTVAAANYGVEDEYVANPEVVPCA